MAGTMNRLGVTTAAAVMVFPFVVWCGSAAAQPSPGVPCLELMQQLAAEPPTVPESLDTAATALNSVVPEAPALPPVPVEDVVHGVTALAAPGPVPPPFEAPPVVPLVADALPLPPVGAPAAPLVQAAAVPAPPVPLAAVPIPSS